MSYMKSYLFDLKEACHKISATEHPYEKKLQIVSTCMSQQGYPILQKDIELILKNENAEYPSTPLDEYEWV
jgi:hypothetical protein